MFQEHGVASRPSCGLCAGRGSQQRAGRTGNVEAAVGLETTLPVDLLRNSCHVIKQPPKVLYQVFAKHPPGNVTQPRANPGESRGCDLIASRLIETSNSLDRKAVEISERGVPSAGSCVANLSSDSPVGCIVVPRY